MSSIFHALNIGTLAAWLSVAGFGTVGILVPEWRWYPGENPVPVEVISVVEAPEIALGEGQTDDPAPALQDPATAASDPQAVTPEIPAMPELPEQAPLPEIPDLPPTPEPEAAKPAPPSEWARHTTPARPQSENPGAKRQSPGNARKADGSTAAGGSGSGGGASDSARLAAGRMPAPVYPAAARRAGQTGTVTVAFTVDTSGRVISAHAVNPSPWPLLNEEAVRTVRRWKFPPGGVMKLQRPIVFQLR